MLADVDFMRVAHMLAVDSPDPSTQIGAIIVDDGSIVGSGINEFPRGVAYSSERLERPLKYKFIEHAERNAIFSAGDCTDCTMYCTWAACSDCARAIIQSGISKVVTHQFFLDNVHDGWVEELDVAKTMLMEAGVEFVYINDEINLDVPLLYAGQEVRF